MNVDPADSAAHQTVAFNESQDLIIAGDRRKGKAFEQQQHFRTATKRATGQFADDEWVGLDLSAEKEGPEPLIVMPEVVHPNRGVNQHGHGRCATVSVACEFAGRRVRFHQEPRGAERFRER